METYAESLRAYADWLEANPGISEEGEICLYQTQRATDLLRLGAELEGPYKEICYLVQKFGKLTIKHVIRNEKLYIPAIKDGKVVWTLKPEFQAIEAQP